MRGLNRFAASPGRPITAAFSTQPYSTFSGGGAGGRGRGRGSISPAKASPVPDQDDNTADEAPFPSFGHGRGHPPFPSSAGLPSFSSLMSSLKSSSSVGRGRGNIPPDHPQSQKQPIFFRREDPESRPEESQFADPSESAPLPPSFSPVLSGFGRGKPTRNGEPDSRPIEENRHLRRAQPIGRSPSSSPYQPKLGNEEAARRAVDILSRGGPSGPGGRGRGGRGVIGRGRGRGRGGRFSGGRGRRDADHEFDLYLGDNADGERLEKRLGEENMKLLAEGFEEMSWRVLPSPMEEAYLDALHTNNLVD